MLYVKVNHDVMNDSTLLESNTTSTDVIGAAYEIDLECMDFAFDMGHIALEAYQESILLEMSDGAESAKKDVEAGNVTDAEFKPAPSNNDKKDDKSTEPAKKEESKPSDSKDNMGIFARIKAFIKKVWEKIKELFRRFINWITGKIGSNEDFIKKFEGQKLGKIKKELPDYAESFKRVLESNNTAKKLYDAAAKMNQYCKELVASNADEEAVNEMIIKLMGDSRFMGSNAASFDAVVKERIDYIIADTKEREVDGTQLLNVLKQNKDIQTKLTNITKEYEKTLKEIDKKADGKWFEINTTTESGDGKKVVHYGALLCKKIATLSARLATGTITQSQKLIVGIRSAIQECAKAGNS